MEPEAVRFADATIDGTARQGVVRPTEHLAGLDSIRFLAALLVVVSHYGLTEYNVTLLPSRTHLGQMAALLLAFSINGPAAVIVFFVISGFCIHLRYAGGSRPIPSSFYARRFLRIVPPAVVFYLLLRMRLFHYWRSPNETVLWSVLCELVYYGLYPAILYVRRRTGWATVLSLATCGAAVALIGHMWRAPIWPTLYVDLGWATWVLGLPCWLVGCVLAERYKQFPALTDARIWSVRCLIVAWGISIEYLHNAFPSRWTHPAVLLDVFSVGVALWLGFEIAHFRRARPPRVLEWAGRWSFSLYLVHTLIPHWAYARTGFPSPMLFSGAMCSICWWNAPRTGGRSSPGGGFRGRPGQRRGRVPPPVLFRLKSR